MDAGTWALLGVVVVLALVVGLLAGVVIAQRRRLDDLGADLLAGRTPQPTEPGKAVVARSQTADPTEVLEVRSGQRPSDFVITRVGEPGVEPVATGVVLSATLGEPLVKAAALAHGVRRALRPESRNRIRFLVRQEVRRTRKDRRREMRQAWREMRARDAA